MIRRLGYFFLLFLFITLFAGLVTAQVATGGSCTLNQQVIANGGGSGDTASIGGTYVIEGTIGQSIAGTQSTAGIYSVNGGFWQSFLAPTAALVTVSGRVVTFQGTPIRGVRLTLFDMTGNAHQSLSNEFGYFQFDGVEAGRTYLLSATSKRFQIATQALTIEDQIADLNIVALP